MVAGRGSPGQPAACRKAAAPASGGCGVCRSPNQPRGPDTGLPVPTRPGRPSCLRPGRRNPCSDRKPVLRLAVSDTPGRHKRCYSSRQCVARHRPGACGIRQPPHFTKRKSAAMALLYRPHAAWHAVGNDETIGNRWESHVHWLSQARRPGTGFAPPPANRPRENSTDP